MQGADGELGVLGGHEDADLDLGGRDHLDIYPFGGQGLEHLQRHAGVTAHADADHRQLGDIDVGLDLGELQLSLGPLEPLDRPCQVGARHGEGDVGRAAVERLQKAKTELKFAEVKSDINVAKISVIGVGMRSHAGVALKMFRTLAERGINIQVISTSEIKISVLIEEAYTELALRALHTAYGLDAA